MIQKISISPNFANQFPIKNFEAFPENSHFCMRESSILARVVYLFFFNFDSNLSYIANFRVGRDF